MLIKSYNKIQGKIWSFLYGEYNFVRFFLPTTIITTIVLTLSIYTITDKGLNFGIDFTGGAEVELELKVPQIVSSEELRKVMSSYGVTNFSVVKTSDGQNSFSIRIGGKNNSQELNRNVSVIKTTLIEVYKYNFIVRKIDIVGPTVGKSLIASATKAILFSLVAMTLYIAIRFKWQFGLAALGSLAHDVIILIGFYSYTQMPFDMISVAVLLTIIGYSVNDTVVIFDRIRDNIIKNPRQEKIIAINDALNRTFSRTFLTSFTTLLAVLVMAFLSSSVLFSFGIAISFGILVGTYSSFFVAAPLLLKAKFTFEDTDEDEKDTQKKKVNPEGISKEK